MFNTAEIMYIGIAYLLGSISSAIIVCWMFKLPDPRTQGSSNPGATNVLRIGGKIPAFLTLLGDMLKGVIAVALAKAMYLSPTEISVVMLAVLLGHLYPVFFHFRGGKGVATALAAFITLSWQFGGAVVITWLVAFTVSRVSSVGALAMIISAPIYAKLLLAPQYFSVIVLMSVVLLLRHRENICRLMQGQEKKIKSP